MPQNESTTKLKVDVSEFTAAMQTAKRQISLANAEFKSATAGMENWANSTDGVADKLKQLDKVLSNEKTILAALEGEYDEVAAAMGADSKEAENLKIKIENQKAAIAKTENQIKNYNDKLQSLKNASKDAQSATGKLQDEIADQEKELKKLSRAYSDAVLEQGKGSKESKDLKKQIDALNKKLQKNKKDLDEASASTEDLGDAQKDTEKSSKGLADILKGGVKAGLATVAAGAAATVTAFLGSAEATREFRESMAKVNTAFTTMGYSSETAKDTFNDFYAVLGDTDRATEAVGNLAKLATSEEDLTKWTEIATGVYATFGDGLPIEALSESANETAKVGKITGNLADALNWATTDSAAWSEALSGNTDALTAFEGATAQGMSAEDAFNEALLACNSEQERSQLITSTLTSLYGDAAAAYEETNGAIMDANRAQAELNDAMAAVGATAEPVMTTLKSFGAEILTSILPSVEQLGEGFTDMLNGVDGAGEKVGAAMSEILRSLITKIVEIAPTVIEMGVSLVSNLIQGLLERMPQITIVALQLVGMLIQALATELPKIVEQIVWILPQILQAIELAFPGIINSILALITQAIPQIITIIAEGLPRLIEAAISLLMGIVQAIPDVINALVAALPGLITAIIDGLLAGSTALLDGALQLFMAIVDALPQIIDSLIAALPMIIEALVSGLTNAIPQLLTAAVAFLMAIVDAIPDIIAELYAAIPQIVIAVCGALINAIPQLLTAAIQLFMTLSQAFGDINREILLLIPKIIVKIIGKLLELLPKLAKYGADIFGKIVAWFAKVIPEAGKKTKEFVEKIISFVATLPGKFWEWLLKVISKIIEWRNDMIAKAVEIGTKFVKNVIDFVKELPGKLKTWLTNTIKNVTSFAGDMAAKGVEAGKNLFDKIVENITGLPDKMLEIGGNIVSGMWNGISDKFEWLSEKIKGFATDVTDKLKGFFGIHSPSRVMRDVIGKNLILGMSEGINRNKGALLDSMQALANDLTNPLNLSVADAKANLISGVSGTSGIASAGVSNNNTSYVFNQYNTSPKALSRIDIYRQTKNQLAFAKGV